ncbi:MAG: glycosyltransferase family 2 protein [Cetobacterium sp.]
MKKSILIITYGREKELFETLIDISKYKKNDLEVLLLDNNLDSSRKEKIEQIFKNSSINFDYYHDGKNYGVALGRNYLIEKASGDILITLDDDIQIENINELVEKTEKYFNADSEIGCLAFNIKNYYTREALKHEIPHGNKKLDFSKNLETYYYIGAGHAIKKEVYKNCGVYPDDLGKYGGEESDLSFRIIQKYKILYTSDIKIFHKVSIDGRMKKEDEEYLRYRNKLRVCKKYLPNKYYYMNFVIWTIYYLIKNRNVKNIIKNISDQNNPILQKLEKSHVENLKKLKARLYY